MLDAVAEAPFVVTMQMIQRSIEQLVTQSIHPFFPAYLHLRQRAGAENTTTEILPRWKELGSYLEVEGASTQHPYFRPFAASGSLSQMWLNANLAGSFAGSSLRAGMPPLKVVEYDSGTRSFALKTNHWELARKHLLFDEKVPIEALFGFLMRDFAILTAGPEPEATDLVDVFLSEFGYDGRESEEVEHLYDLSIINAGVAGWFELWMFDVGSPVG
jgi:hypothetical protein